MPITRVYICPDCEKQFSFLHLQRDEPPPDYCPKCGSWMGESPEPMPTAAFISKAQHKAGDWVYRKLEQDSEARAEMAGDPSIKITNLKDNLREGDVAAMQPVNNVVSQYAQQVAPTGTNPYFSTDVAGQVAATKIGPVRDTGARAIAAIQGGQSLVSRPSPASVASTIRGSFGGR